MSFFLENRLKWGVFLKIWFKGGGFLTTKIREVFIGMKIPKKQFYKLYTHVAGKMGTQENIISGIALQ